jgi:hypothetical protein
MSTSTAARGASASFQQVVSSRSSNTQSFLAKPV